MYLAFIDIKSAFDTVSKQAIWNALTELSVSYPPQQATKRAYVNAKGRVRIKGKESQIFEMKKGIKQGDSLSPLLFLRVMNQIMQEAKEPRLNLKVGNWNLEPINIQCLIYANEIVFLADSTKKLQLAINKWNRAIVRRGMEINTNKTKIMKIEKNDTNENTRITFNREELEWVNN